MKRAYFLIFYIFSSFNGISQNIESYINEGLSNSYEIKLAKAELRLAELEYRNIQLSNRPSLLVAGNAPVYNKDNYGITQPDGTIKFLRRSQNYSNIGFSFLQPLPFTGGNISLNTDLYRFDDFVSKSKQYNGTPIFLQIQQPLFAYNKYKWDKIIESLKLKEANKNHSFRINQIKYEVCSAYFDVIEAQTNKQLAKTNLENNKANLTHEIRKVQLGTSTEDKVLQLEILLLNSQREIESSEMRIKTAFANLNLIVNKSDTLSPELEIPEILPTLQLNKDQLIEEFLKQSPEHLSFQRKLLEAQSNTARVKSQTNNINITASYGLTNSALTIPSIYQNSYDQQRFNISFSVPLLTWGKKKNSILTAKLNEKNIEISRQAEKAKIITEITSIISEIPLLKRNVLNTLRIDTLSEKRFLIINRLYISGKASLIELQGAQVEKDSARKNYIIALRKFWESWYLLHLKLNSDE